MSQGIPWINHGGGANEVVEEANQKRHQIRGPMIIDVLYQCLRRKHAALLMSVAEALM
jgi:hypothetical protein